MTRSVTEPHSVGAGFGHTLRSMRKDAKLTLKELATKVGCTESMLSKIERGRVSPTLRMTHRLATELDVKFAVLIAESEVKNVYIRAPGSRLQMSLSGHGAAKSQVVLERAVAFREGNILDANLHVIPPGMGSDGLYQHEAETVGYVVSGRIELNVDGVVTILEDGYTFAFDSRLPHGYRNLSDCDAKVFWVNGFASQ